MARKTKAPPRRPASKKKAATAKATKAKAPTRKAGARKSAGSRGTEVERNWATYLKQRTALEQAVATVQAAEAALSSAREIEAARRKEFDDSKQSLEQMLEVERASDPRTTPRRKPADILAPAVRPSKHAADQELSLG